MEVTRPEHFINDPWKEQNSHQLYRESFLNMRPAPEYASGEVILASLYRRVGFSGRVSEGRVPALGRDFDRRLQTGRDGKGESRNSSDANLWRTVISPAISSPKQPNQTARRFLQLSPIVPDAAMYSFSARLSANSWNPGELIARVIAFGEREESRVIERLNELFFYLSVNENDDVWARFLNKEFLTWRTNDDLDAWRPPADFTEELYLKKWRDSPSKIPAQQFVSDLDRTLLLKNNLTRRQWTTLLESILRIGSAAHVLWLCRAGSAVSEAMRNVINGEPPPNEIEIRRKLDIGDPFWRYGQAANTVIKEYARNFVLSRLEINLVLWHCASLSKDLGLPPLSEFGLASVPAITSFMSYLADLRPHFKVQEFWQQLHQAYDDHPRVVGGKEGIGSNISEFLRHVLGQRQTHEPGMDSYDQGYYLGKKGIHKAAPWVVSLGPVSVLTMVHCCTHGARGPRTVEDFCRHLAHYGIELRAQDVPHIDIGQTLRNLGLVLDSPDAEGGMVLRSPLESTAHKK